MSKTVEKTAFLIYNIKHKGGKSMSKDSILDFINDVIIENGIENNLDSATIKQNIADYKAYLIANSFADENALKAISRIEEKVEEYYELAKSFKKAGLNIPAIKLDPTNVKPHRDHRAQITQRMAPSGCGSTREERTTNYRGC